MAVKAKRFRIRIISHVTAEQRKEIDEAAILYRISISELIRVAVLEYIRERKKI